MKDFKLKVNEFVSEYDQSKQSDFDYINLIFRICQLHELYIKELKEDKELMLESLDMMVKNLEVIHTQAKEVYKLHSEI